LSAQTFSRLRAAQVARRTALVATSTGLALSIAAPAAMAANENQVDPASLTTQARASLPVQPSVVVPADATWTVAPVEVTGSKPAPPPAPVERRAVTGSRSSERTAPAAAAVSAPSVSGNAVLNIAVRYVGVPYVRGGSTPAGFDCSGFTQYVFAQLGISLPRSSAAQRYAGTVVSADQAQPGDLIWWPGHVGIYMGNGQHIAARQPGTPLKISPIYRANPTFIRVG
jgi:cell wall-associated NlpC family hydrolase